LFQLAHGLAEIDLAQFGPALQNPKRSANLQMEIFRLLPPIRFIEKHGADSKLQPPPPT
jgi:hypothetical protein